MTTISDGDSVVNTSQYKKSANNVTFQESSDKKKRLEKLTSEA